MGYRPNDTRLSQLDDLKELLTTYKESLFIRNLVNSYAAKHPGKVKLFESVAASH
jgi:hypothetical protein